MKKKVRHKRFGYVGYLVGKENGKYIIIRGNGYIMEIPKKEIEWWKELKPIAEAIRKVE